MKTDNLVAAGKQVAMLVLGIVAGETVSTYLVKKALPSTMYDTMKQYVPFGLAAGTIALTELTTAVAGSPEMKTIAQGFAIGCVNNGLRELGVYSKINTGLGLSGFSGMDTLGSPMGTAMGTADDVLFEDEVYLETNELAGGYNDDYGNRSQHAELGTGAESQASALLY